MRVLITGGADFAGSHLSDAITTDVHSVVCAIDLRVGLQLSLEDFRAVVEGRAVTRK